MVFKKLLTGLFIILFAGMAHADLAARNSAGDTIVLHTTPCSNPKIVAAVPKELAALLKNADAVISKTEWKACWLFNPQDNSQVGVLFDDGDFAVIPLSEFKERGI